MSTANGQILVALGREPDAATIRAHSGNRSRGGASAGGQPRSTCRPRRSATRRQAEDATSKRSERSNNDCRVSSQESRYSTETVISLLRSSACAMGPPGWESEQQGVISTSSHSASPPWMAAPTATGTSHKESSRLRQARFRDMSRSRTSAKRGAGTPGCHAGFSQLSSAPLIESLARGAQLRGPCVTRRGLQMLRGERTEP
mmetsp:Transcript_20178/g.55888  ORF Transcript_20178/g.55888 Transcript_20178/m.55888 type:complete len:202 (+) Transcript_20178:1832-2437(+)